MAQFDHGTKLLAEKAGRELARVGGVDCDGWEGIETTIQVTAERLADRAFRARKGRTSFVVYMEFYTYWDNDAPWGMLVKSAMLAEREHLPVRTLAFILRPKGYKKQGGTFQLAVDGQATQQVWFTEIPLWLQKPQPWWEDFPGLMALYPLCQHGKRPRAAIGHAAGASEGHATDLAERADLLTALSVFGGLVYPDLDVAAIIGREKMRESKFYQDVLAEGGVLTRRADIVRFLRGRFGGDPPVEVARALDAIDDHERLGELVDLAATCRNMREFRKALAPAE